jgi:hypothetical protein
MFSHLSELLFLDLSWQGKWANVGLAAGFNLNADLPVG